MEFLSRQGISYTAKDVSSDAEARQELIALGSRSTPTITIDGETFVGFNPSKLSAALSLGRS
jgi:glutaredoxin